MPGNLLTIVAGLLVVWLLLLAALWLLRPRGVGLRELLGVVPDLLRLVRQLLGDPKVPADVKVALGILLVWVVSPIDLVPEFIPVIGPVDDLIVAVLVLRYVRRRQGSADLEQRWQGGPQGWAMLRRMIG